MNKNLIAAALIPFLLTLTACGGGDSPEVTPHCSVYTRALVEQYKDSTKYIFQSNACNRLTEAEVVTRTYPEEPNPAFNAVISANHDVLDFTLMYTKYTIEGQETVVGTSDYTLSNVSHTYSYNYGDDFITRHSYATSNTDIIYSHEDEYNLILGHTLNDTVILNIDEALACVVGVSFPEGKVSSVNCSN